MKENILISTIITTYKRSNMLRRAILSVINQNYSNIEVIVVDDNDGGTEYRRITEEILTEFGDDSRVIYLKHKQNMNGAFARNTGINCARGELITFLDDDDYFTPERFSTLIPILYNTGKDVGLISSSYQLLKNGKLSEIQNVNYEENITLELLQTKLATGSGSNFIIKKEVIDKIGFFDVNFIRHQDYEFLLRVSLEYKFISSNKNLLIIQVDSVQQNKASVEEIIEVKKLYFDKFSFLINKDNEEKIKQSQYKEIIKLIIKNKDLKKNRFIFKKIISDYSFYNLIKLFVSIILDKLKK